MLTPSLHDAHIALYDIDAERLKEAELLITAINRNANQGRAHITTHLGISERRAALRDCNYVVNAIQVGGYDPCTITDFEIPKKYNLRQTIADTIGIGGIFRSLRTIPIMLDIARDMEAVCPRAWLLNYTNPMCAITSSILRASSVRCVGLCHSVQGCTRDLFHTLSLEDEFDQQNVRWEIAGINHQAWLLSLEHNGVDIYPRIRERARELVDQWRTRGGGAWLRSLRDELNILKKSAATK